jgi:hypothetical protein
MLLATSGNQNVPKAPTEQLLSCISDSCRAQSTADLEFFVHWSRHLLASIQKITNSDVVFFYVFAVRYVKLYWPPAAHKLMAKRAGVFFYDLQSPLV